MCCLRGDVDRCVRVCSRFQSSASSTSSISMQAVSPPNWVCIGNRISLGGVLRPLLIGTHFCSALSPWQNACSSSYQRATDSLSDDIEIIRGILRRQATPKDRASCRSTMRSKGRMHKWFTFLESARLTFEERQTVSLATGEALASKRRRPHHLPTRPSVY